MEQRQLGKSNLKIAPIVFGGNVFGWTVDEKRSFELLDAFVAHGFNCIDTADVYSKWATGNKGGESETILGNWIKQRGYRDKVVIATKVGMELAPNHKGLGKSHIIESVEGSLKRLQTDYIDLYQAHADDPETPLEETLAAFDDLINAGKVRVIGASNYGAHRLKSALEISTSKNLNRFETLQPKYNLVDRKDYEADLEPLCRERNLGVIPYYSLASGFLTGKYRDDADIGKSPRGQGVRDKYLNERGFRVLKALDQVAEELGANPAQVALAWALHRPTITAPIVSATRLEQLEEIVQAPQLKLTKHALDILDTASKF